MKVKAAINKIVDKPESMVKAYASVSFDGAFAVHGIKVCENENGRFVSMPSMPYKDRNGETKYRHISPDIQRSKGSSEPISAECIRFRASADTGSGNRDRPVSGRSRRSQGISRTGDRNVML